MIKGQKLFVAFSKPPSKLIDSNTLFLNFLPENITEEKILVAFNDQNVFYNNYFDIKINKILFFYHLKLKKTKVKEIRLFYDDENTVKEFAYVEFHTHVNFFSFFYNIS